MKRGKHLRKGMKRVCAECMITFVTRKDRIIHQQSHRDKKHALNTPSPALQPAEAA